MTERSKNKISVIAATSISTLLYTSCLCPFDVIKNTQIASQSRITARIAIKEIVAASGILGL